MADLRMPDINDVTIAGRLTRDPGQRPNGPVGFGMASTRYYKDKSGERREDTVFIDVEVWGAAGEYVKQNIAKGDPVLVEGRLKFDAWEATDGSKRSQIRIAAQRVQALAWKGKSGGDEKPATKQRPAYDDDPIGEEDVLF